MAPNEKAIRKWIAQHRSDLSSEAVDNMMNIQAIFAVMAMSFEAGRDFQRANPDSGAKVSFLTEPTDSYNWNY